MKVLFNADDFGLTKSITDGIIKAHTDGLVSRATLMMNGLASDYAVKQAKEYPSLKVGIHLVLTWGKPLLKLPSLVNDDGMFKFNSLLKDELDLDAIKQEWTAQIEAFLQTGLSLDHIDSHHHVHGDERLKGLVIELAKTYKVPVRYMESIKDEKDILLTDYLYDGFYLDGVHEGIFDDLLELPYETIEVMTHPSYVDEDLRAVSSYVEDREKELHILTQIKVPEGIEII